MDPVWLIMTVMVRSFWLVRTVCVFVRVALRKALGFGMELCALFVRMVGWIFVSIHSELIFNFIKYNYICRYSCIETHCYFLSTTTATWNMSRIYCQQAGADLMVINDNTEYTFISGVAQNLMPTTDWIEAWVGSVTLSKASREYFWKHFIFSLWLCTRLICRGCFPVGWSFVTNIHK